MILDSAFLFFREKNQVLAFGFEGFDFRIDEPRATKLAHISRGGFIPKQKGFPAMNFQFKGKPYTIKTVKNRLVPGVVKLRKMRAGDLSVSQLLFLAESKMRYSARRVRYQK